MEKSSPKYNSYNLFVLIKMFFLGIFQQQELITGPIIIIKILNSHKPINFELKGI